LQTIALGSVGAQIFISYGPQENPKMMIDESFFIYFITVFAKIYGPPQILQNYTSAVVARGARDITPWPTAVGAAMSGPLAWADIASYPTTLVLVQTCSVNT
jgi:hypothetical protein